MLKSCRAVGERGDNPYVNFYWDYYSQGKPCYVKTEYPDLPQAVEMICENKGAAVLAHPGVNLKNHEELFGQIVQSGLHGVDAFSSYPLVRTKPAVQSGGHG